MIESEAPIAALASGSGAAAIAIIRGSGKNCHTLLSPLIKAKKPFADLSAGRAYLVDFYNPKSADVLDEPLLLLFKSPASYTGEDSFELHVHGGAYIVESCLQNLYQHGFKPADPGEFTQRAYLNGKMDLSSAEGIQALVTAVSKQQWLAGRQLSNGILLNHIQSLRTKALEAMAFLEARIDFPDEEETAAVEYKQVDERVTKVKEALLKLKSTYVSGRVAKDGLRVALVGAPNAGKSTLMNALLGEERAIVTDIEGTTRDYLEESCLLEGSLIRLIDTAGIRDRAGKVETIGIQRSFEIAKNSDIIALLVPKDANQEATKVILAWIDKLRKENPEQGLFLLRTKDDLSAKQDQALQESLIDLKKKCSAIEFSISCENGQGLENFTHSLAELVKSKVNLLTERPFITTARHKAAVENALEKVDNFERARVDGAYEEMVAFELREAAAHLEEIIGKVDSDEVLGVLFSQFCVGK